MTTRRAFLSLVAATMLAACGGSGSGDGGGGGGTPQPPPPDPGGWTAMAPMPQARSEHSVAALDGRVYVAGGFGAQFPDLPRELLIYDAASDGWSTGAPLPQARHHGALVAFDGRLYFIGGYTGAQFVQWAETDTLFIYDVASDTWSTGPAMPGPLGAHAAAVTSDGMIHVVGGAHATSGGHQAQPAHWVYDIANGAWNGSTPLPTPREHLGAAYHNGRVYVAGGRAGAANQRTFEAYDVETQQWTTLADVPTARSGIAVVAFEGRIHVFGGEDLMTNGVTAAAERYDPVSDGWEALQRMPTARHGLGAGVAGAAIYVVGGGPQAGLTVSSVNERWTP